jgi:hypothetical protein
MRKTLDGDVSSKKSFFSIVGESVGDTIFFFFFFSFSRLFCSRIRLPLLRVVGEYVGKYVVVGFEFGGLDGGDEVVDELDDVDVDVEVSDWLVVDDDNVVVAVVAVVVAVVVVAAAAAAVVVAFKEVGTFFSDHGLFVVLVALFSDRSKIAVVIMTFIWGGIGSTDGDDDGTMEIGGVGDDDKSIRSSIEWFTKLGLVAVEMVVFFSCVPLLQQSQ